jgi:hypothetical protein
VNFSRKKSYSYLTLSPWCSDYGIKRQYFTIEYQGDEYEGVESGSSYQAVEKQDFFMWRSANNYPIWPPEVGNGDGIIEKVELQTSTGTTKATQYNSNFSSGWYRDQLFSSKSIIFFRKKNPLIQAFPAGSYKIKATARHYMDPSEWFPSEKTSSVTTNTF